MRRLVGSGLAAAVAFSMLACDTLNFRENQYIGIRDYSIDPSAKFERVELTDLVTNPTHASHVEFEAIFRQRDETIWAPFFTIFTPEKYCSFSVWPSDARLWEASARISYVPTLFIDKYHNPDFNIYLNLRKAERVWVKGIVQSDFQRRPWIMVLSIRSIGGLAYSEDSLGSLLAGIVDTDEGRHASAIRLLEEALTGTLADAGRLAAYQRLAWLWESRAATTKNPEDWGRARSNYDQVIQLDPADTSAREGAGRCDRAYERQGAGQQPPPGPWKKAAAGGASESSVRGPSDAVLVEWKAKYDEAVAARSRSDVMAADAKAAREKAEMTGADANRRAEAAQKAAADAQTAADAAQLKSQNDMKMAQQQLQDATAARDKVQAEMDDVRKQMSAGGDATKILGDKVTALEGEKAKLDESVKALTTERDELKAKAAAAVPPGGDEELKKQLAAKEDEVKKQVEELGKLKMERDDLAKKLAEAPAGGDEALKKQVAEKDQQIADKDKEITGQKETIENQKEVIKKLQEELQKK